MADDDVTSPQSGAQKGLCPLKGYVGIVVVVVVAVVVVVVAVVVATPVILQVSYSQGGQAFAPGCRSDAFWRSHCLSYLGETKNELRAYGPGRRW